MPKFRKRPIVIEAVKYTGINDERIAAIEQFLGKAVEVRDVGNVLHIAIPTLEGEMMASPGDWIIRGAKGEFYPCKPDIFAATYEAVR